MNEVDDAVRSGDLDAARAAALSAVKAAPTNHDARRRFIDVLIVAGDLEAADRQAAILAKLSPDLAVGLALLRGRLRAARARVEWFMNGAVPAFPGGPTERDALAMELAVALRDDPAAAPALVERLDAAAETSLSVDGTVRPFRDADGRVPHALEVLCSDGSYMWVDCARVGEVRFEPPATLRDLAWRRASLTLDDGSQTDVVLPATYHAPEPTDAHRLARETEWRETHGVVCGVGQKAFLAGDDAVYALELQTLAAEDTAA